MFFSMRASFLLTSGRHHLAGRDAPDVGQAAALVQLGRIDHARVAIQQARAQGTLWTVGAVKTAVHSGIGVGIDDARMTALWEGLRLAGLPE